MKQDVTSLFFLLLAYYTKSIFSITIASTFSVFSDVTEYVCPEEFILFEKQAQEWMCMYYCLIDGTCEGIDYHEDTLTCHGCKGLKAIDCQYSPIIFNHTAGTRMYARDKSLLISGVLPVSDDSFTESGHVGTHPVVYACVNARYCKLEPVNSGLAAWSTYTDGQQWIQAQFLRLAVVRGIYLLGRPLHDQYVTSFKLASSPDCNAFQYYNSSDGTDMIFPGHIDISPITTNLPSPITALCVRIKPVTWNNFVSVRFDVLGRYP